MRNLITHFVSLRPFFWFHEHQAKFAKKVHHPTRFFDKVDSFLATVTLSDAHQAATKDEKLT